MTFRRAALGAGGILPASLLFAVLRIPSFFEPRWYTDEAGYSSTARAVMRGAVLYSQAWTNKPPIQIWLVALPLRIFGPSEAGLHALTFVAGLLALAGVAYGGRTLLTPGRALLASVGFAVAIGLPTFDAQIAVPESLLIAPITWAGAVLTGRVVRAAAPASWWWRWGWAVAAGVLTGVAIGIQQTSLADAAAFVVILVLSPRTGRRDLGIFAGAALAVTAAWLVPSLALAGVSHVYSALVGFYVDYASFSAPHSPAARLLRAAGPLLALAGAVLARRQRGPAWPLLLWTAAVLAVAAAANRNYPHFLTPAMAPGLLALASLPGPPVGSLMRLSPLMAGVAMTSFYASVAWIEWKGIDAYLHWPNAVLTGSLSRWGLSLDARAPSDTAAAAWIRAHGYARSRAVVWSSDAWPYLLADLPLLLPTAPIYNDVVLMGSGRAVADRVAAIDPVLIVASVDDLQAWPDIRPLLASRYKLEYITYRDLVYVRRMT